MAHWQQINANQNSTGQCQAPSQPLRSCHRRSLPPNSPDCNVLDLGFFAAIQSLQQREPARTIDELIAAVLKAFQDLPVESLDNVFLSLQGVLECIMTHQGGNSFKLPHIGKAALRRAGELPESLDCDPESIEEALDSLFMLENSNSDQ